MRIPVASQLGTASRAPLGVNKVFETVCGALLAGAHRPRPTLRLLGCTRARGYRNRAQHTRRLARRLLLHSSSVPGVNRPGGTTAHGAARRIATVAAALLPDCVFLHRCTCSGHLNYPRRPGRCSCLQSQSCFRRRQCPVVYRLLPRPRCRGGCWPGWGSKVGVLVSSSSQGCTRRSEILIGRSIRGGLRGAYCRIARRFRG